MPVVAGPLATCLVTYQPIWVPVSARTDSTQAFTPRRQESRKAQPSLKCGKAKTGTFSRTTIPRNEDSLFTYPSTPKAPVQKSTDTKTPAGGWSRVKATSTAPTMPCKGHRIWPETAVLESSPRHSLSWASGELARPHTASVHHLSKGNSAVHIWERLQGLNEGMDEKYLALRKELQKNDS